MRIKFVIVILFVLLIGFVLFRFKGQVPSEVKNLFSQPEILKPLAQNDPEGELRSLLLKKSIDIVSSPVASGSGILVVLTTSETEVLFDENKDIKTQVEALQIILNKLAIDGIEAKRIDLRYSSPILTY